MSAAITVAVANLGSALFWAVLLALDPSPWSRWAATVIASGLLITAAVVVAGIVVDHSRLARRLGIGLLIVEAVIALFRSFSVLWWAGVAITAAAALLIVGPWLKGWIRERPSAASPPRAAVVLPVVLLSMPTLAALAAAGANFSGVAAGLVSLAWVLTVWYLSGRPLAMAAVRAGVPLLAGAAFWLPASSIWVWLLLAALATGLAWTAGARLAVRPLIERGRVVSIPPQLAPGEVLDAAGVDRRGRRIR